MRCALLLLSALSSVSCTISTPEGDYSVRPNDFDYNVSLKPNEEAIAKPQGEEVAIALQETAEIRCVDPACRVNVRSGPGVEYTAPSYGVHGDRVTVLERRDGWVQVQFKSGAVGWVANSLLSD